MSKPKKEDTIPATIHTGGAIATYDYSQYANQGFETHTREDYAVPFLGVLQSNSPLIETDSEARPGMLVNTVTNATYDGKKGINFIPVCTLHNVLEWKPRDAGGGFVAAHEMSSELVQKCQKEQEFGKWKSPAKNDLSETYSVYGIFVREDGTSEQMIISFASTKVKVYKQWMTRARTIQIPIPGGRRINPPLFAHKYRITTVSEKNAKGSFYNFNVGFDGGSAEACRLAPDDTLFQEAVAFFNLIKEGNVKAAHESQQGVEETDIPFA